MAETEYIADPKGLFSCSDPCNTLFMQNIIDCVGSGGGGGSGQSCLMCGMADPVADPDCDCAIYYRTDTSAFWYWDDNTATWIPFIV